MQVPAFAETQGRFGQRFWPLFLLGLIGVATLPLILVPMIRAGALPAGTPDLSLPALVAVSMINPVLFLACLTALGSWLAPKLGLRSLIVLRSVRGATLRPQLRASAPLAVGMGLALSVLTLLLEVLFQPLLSAEWKAAAAMNEESGISALIAGLLYGGVTEEIMLRWGVLSFVAWAVWRLFQRGKGAPSSVTMWTAILLAALLFGVGHLPAAASMAPLDSVMVLRVVGLNALGGLVFGWLYWRHHLEAAMLAHAGANVGLALLTWSGLAGMILGSASFAA